MKHVLIVDADASIIERQQVSSSKISPNRIEVSGFASISNIDGIKHIHARKTGGSRKSKFDYHLIHTRSYFVGTYSISARSA